MDEIAHATRSPLNFNWVSATDSPDFTFLIWALNHSSVIALDSEWKPIQLPEKEKRPQQQNQKRMQKQRPIQKQKRQFPTVSILQLACRFRPGVVGFPQFDKTLSTSELNSDELIVFLLDLQTIPLTSVYEPLREMFVSPDVLKLGFDFCQDLRYLSSTFCSQGCDPGFNRVEPYIDIWNMYDHWQKMQSGRKVSQQKKGLAAICKEILEIHLPKELQCSDWSNRPLTEEQKIYAADDANSLLKIFAFLQAEADGGDSVCKVARTDSSILCPQLRGMLEKGTASKSISKDESHEASDAVQALPNVGSFESASSAELSVLDPFDRTSRQMDDFLLNTIQKYGCKLSLENKIFPQCTGSNLDANRTLKWVHCWEGPEPWDLTLGGDGCPRFLCDEMVCGVAEFLRGVAVDAVVLNSKDPDCRELLDQAGREKRVLLTMRKRFPEHEYLKKNQICILRNNKIEKQIKEVIETFQLTKFWDIQPLFVGQLISRRTNRRKRFISERNGKLQLEEKLSKQPDEYKDNLSPKERDIICQIGGKDDSGPSSGVAPSNTWYNNCDADASSALDTKLKEMEENFQQQLVEIEKKHAAEIRLLRSEIVEMRTEFEKKGEEIEILKANMNSVMAHTGTAPPRSIFSQNPLTSKVVCSSSFVNATQPPSQLFGTIFPSVEDVKLRDKYEQQNPLSIHPNDLKQDSIPTLPPPVGSNVCRLDLFHLNPQKVQQGQENVQT